MKGEERYVPGNYVKLKRDVPWFLGHIEREEAEDILRNAPHGSFLIRNRQKTKPNDTFLFGLSVKNENCPEIVQHYRIAKDEEGLYWMYENRRFSSLDELVLWYSDPQNDPEAPQGAPQLHHVDLGFRGGENDIGKPTPGNFTF